MPLIEAAVDETRDGLKELWARLLAAAMHPERTSLVRQSFITIVKQMDPLDALTLQKLGENMNWSPNARDALAAFFKTSADEIAVSFINLTNLGCVNADNHRDANPVLSVTGRLLIQATRG